MSTKKIAIEHSVAGTPDVLFRVQGYSAAEGVWATHWYCDCAEACRKENFLRENDCENVTFAKYERV